jgi:hypothetical protein
MSCWAWSDFPTGGAGAPGLSIFKSCCISPCLHIVLAMFIGIHMIACHHVLQLHTCPRLHCSQLACMLYVLIHAYIFGISNKYVLGQRDAIQLHTTVCIYIYLSIYLTTTCIFITSIRYICACMQAINYKYRGVCSIKQSSNQSSAVQSVGCHA